MIRTQAREELEAEYKQKGLNPDDVTAEDVRKRVLLNISDVRSLNQQASRLKPREQIEREGAAADEHAALVQQQQAEAQLSPAAIVAGPPQSSEQAMQQILDLLPAIMQGSDEGIALAARAVPYLSPRKRKEVLKRLRVELMWIYGAGDSSVVPPAVRRQLAPLVNALRK